MTVLYNPDYPEDFMIDAKSFKVGYIVFMVVGVALALIGVAMLFMNNNTD